MKTALRLVAVLGLLVSPGWTAAQSIDNNGIIAEQRLRSQSTRSGERELILEVPRQGWLDEK
jgi:hypothetical protein